MIFLWDKLWGRDSFSELLLLLAWHFVPDFHDFAVCGALTHTRLFHFTKFAKPQGARVWWVSLFECGGTGHSFHTVNYNAWCWKCRISHNVWGWAQRSAMGYKKVAKSMNNSRTIQWIESGKVEMKKNSRWGQQKGWAIDSQRGHGRRGQRERLLVLSKNRNPPVSAIHGFFQSA